jgi:L-asparaginase II
MTVINPVLAEITRGHSIESRHRGAFVIADRAGKIVEAQGDIKRPIFPRSAVKAFQCLPVIASGAADRYGFTEEEIALCCSSHIGEPIHIRVAASMLAKAGISEAAYECGAHWPDRIEDKAAIAAAHQQPRSIHNNCSGKHAGMLAMAKHIGAPLQGYVLKDHPVQKAVAAALDEYCEANTAAADWGIDGCSVPTWATPLLNLALGFARLFAADNVIGTRIAKSVAAHPMLVAGTGRFDSRMMAAVPRLFVKVGAEGVYCGAIPHADLGFALKIDDGGVRGAEVAIASALAQLPCWTSQERDAIASFTHSTMRNWRQLEVGESRASF